MILRSVRALPSAVRDLLRPGPHTISPTAHYTGHVWARNGIGPPELDTPAGRFLYGSLSPAMTISGAVGGPTLEGMLLARHRVIDSLLHDAVHAGTVTQIVEIAAGMSPRGHAFARRYGAILTYVEADLPAMAQRKRDALEPLGTLGSQHSVADLDVRHDHGEASLEALAGELDPERGIAVVTEGLLNYLPTDAVSALWRRISETFQPFPHGMYLSDMYLPGDGAGLADKTFIAGLQAFVRSPVHVHFRTADQAGAALRQAGFDTACVHAPADFADRIPGARHAGAARIRVLEARCHREDPGAARGLQPAVDG